MSAVEVSSTVRPRSDSTARRWLLACGVVAGVLYTFVQDAVGLALYSGYSPISQAVSELSAVGAPSRPVILVTGLLSNAFLIAFGVGVWQSAHGRRSRRAVAGLLVAFGCLGPLWLPFPMTSRADITGQEPAALTDVMHVVLGALTVLTIVATVTIGAVAWKGRFRWYSVVTLGVILVAAFATFATVPTIAAAQATPLLGLAERVNIGAWYLWIAVLGFSLLAAARSPDVPLQPESAD